MKSLRYILGGRPRNVDDCLHYAKEHSPHRVTVDVVTEESVSEMRILQQFVGSFRWEFPDRSVHYNEVYGCLLIPAKKPEITSLVAAANAKLKRRLAKIRDRGIRVAPTGDRKFAAAGLTDDSAKPAHPRGSGKLPQRPGRRPLGTS